MPNSILKLKNFFLVSLLVFSALTANAELDGFSVVKTFRGRDVIMPKEGLKVVWWNIGCGLETTKERKAKRLLTTELEENLIHLTTSSYKPHILILGEFCPQNMPSKDLETLKAQFRHSFHLQRNIPKNASFNRGGSSGNGFLILSDYSVNVVQNETLYANTKSADHKDNRRYLLFKVKKDGVDYLINPVHLVNPWRKLYNDTGTFGVFNELTSGQNNSNAVQIQNLIEMNDKFVDRAENLLTIGDFNSPGSIYGFSGYGYKLMNRYMTDLMSGHEETFLGEGPYPSSNIDHAFGNNIRSTYSKVWPLQGSKHLPIYIVVE